MNLRWRCWDAFFRLKGEPVIPLYGKVDKHQWLDANQVAQINSERLARILPHAIRTVPYYRRFDGATSLTDFPVLDKRQLQEGFEELRSDEVQPGHHWLNSTSGSSGRPTNIVFDSMTHTWRTATGWRGDCFGGFHPTDSQIILWGLRREKRGPLKSWFADRLFNRRLFTIFNLDESRTRYIHGCIMEMQPRILCGYVSGLLGFVHYAKRLGLKPPRVRKVIPTAESCTPEQAAIIREYFEAPVCQRYGAVEVGDLAHQCEHGTWHIHADNLKIEVEDAEGNVSERGKGNLLVTTLSNYTMPLIRYRIGDIGDLTPVDCPCGRGLPTMTSVLGRTAEFVYCSDGSRISSLAFTHSLRKFPIRQFQIVQEQLEEVTVNYIPQDICTDLDLEHLTAELVEVIDGRLKLQMVEVKAIDPLPSGKHSHIISLLASNVR